MNNAKSPFVSLHNHTQFSFLDGFNDVDDLFKRASELNQGSIAITEHGVLNSLNDAYKASKKHGVKLVPGMEAYFTTDLTTKKNNHLVLLAKNEQGYRNLLRLGYESFKNQSSGYMGKKTPRLSWEHLEQWNEGIFALTACSNGILAKTLITDNDEPAAICHMKRLHEIFNDRFFLEIQPHALKHIDTKGREVNQAKLNEAMLRYSKDYGIPYVITCDAHYRDADSAKYHDFMLAIKDHAAVDDPDRFRYGVQDMYLKTHEEIISFFGNSIAEEGMRNSIRIMEACDEPHYLAPKGPILAKFPVKDEPKYPEFKNWKDGSCPELDEDKAYLRYACIEGFKEKFGELPLEKRKEYWERTKYELSILEGKGFCSYMLTVADFINWAKREGSRCGSARGSAAGSLVAYLTGITTVNPMEYGLIFERFQNAEKKSFPDIDSDFADPNKIKGYLKQKYGEDRVASISNYSTETAKVALKDTARSLRIGGDKTKAFEIANYLTSLMPDADTLEEAMANSAEFSREISKYPELIEYTKKVQGLIRNWGVHAAGVVIADQPIYEICPVRIEDDLMVTQWEKTRCEDFGFVKIDCLGLETLNVIDDTLRMIKETTGESVNVDTIALDDKVTYDMIGEGDTAGVFQLEASMTPFCVKLKPRDIEGLSAINALGRPSCLPEAREEYIRRAQGESPVTYPHESLRRGLEKTNGVLLYEESTMYIAQDCAGWDLNKADALRKISKLKGKDPELVLKTESAFIADSMAHQNISYELAKKIWDEYIEVLGRYSFNKSHSVSYSIISYQTAWLKCHYPSQYMCALLNSENPNSDKAQEYLTACSMMGIEIRPPNILLSEANYKVTGDKEITTGLAAIKGAGEKALEEIMRIRPKDVAEFFTLVNARVVNKGVIEALIKAGAFDCFGVKRKYMFENYDNIRTSVKAKTLKLREVALLDAIQQGPERFAMYEALGRAQKTAYRKEAIDEILLSREQLAPLKELVLLDLSSPEWELKERLQNEMEVLGRTITGKMHDAFASFFRKGNPLVTPLSKISSLDANTRIKIEVLVKSLKKELKIKNGPRTGQKFGKYTVEDVYGNVADVTLWSEDYAKYKHLLKDGTPIKAICKVSEYMGVKDISLSSMENIAGKIL